MRSCAGLAWCALLAVPGPAPAQGLKERAALRHGVSPVPSVAFAGDGKTFASGSWDKTIKLWDAAGKELRRLEGHTDFVTAVAQSADGATLASGSYDGTVVLWDATTGKARTTLKGHSKSVFCLAMTADGKTVASGGEDRTLIVWDPAAGKPVHTFGHEKAVAALALTPDGKVVASGSYLKEGEELIGRIRVWETATGKEAHAIRGHAWLVHCVAITADGKTLATGSGDFGTLSTFEVKLWDLTTGKELRTLRGAPQVGERGGVQPGRQAVSLGGRRRDHRPVRRGNREGAGCPGSGRRMASPRRRVQPGRQDAGVRGFGRRGKAVGRAGGQVNRAWKRDHRS
jgi:WD domain, G-beta repeat